MKVLLRRIADYIRECDKVFLVLCTFASSYGCVAVFSATYRTSNSIQQFLMQFFCMIIGLVVVFIISSFDYHNYRKILPLIVFISLGLVFATFFFGYSPGSTDDKAWLLFPGGISFQPSEFLKIVFILTFAYHIHRIGDNIHKFYNILLLCLHGIFPVLLIHFQGDDGTALVFAFIFLGMMFMSGIKLRYFIISGIIAVVSLPIFYLFVMNEDQQARVLSLFSPTEKDYLGVLWQQGRGRIAFANGGFAGKGLFEGPYVQSGVIPEGHNDFILSSIGEELGFVGVIVVFIVLLAISIKILHTSHLAGDKMGSLICIGVFSLLSSQIIMNVGMNLSLLPVIGVNLPFFSAGGSSLVCTFIGIGLVMDVYIFRKSGTLYLHDF